MSLGACATTNIESDGGFTSYGIDFRPYTNNDFLITTEKPNGDYKAIGLIRIDQTPKIKQASLAEYNRGDTKEFRAIKIYDKTNPVYYLVERIETQKSIDELYNISKEWGANAIFNLDIQRSNLPNYPTIEIITVSGLAVLIE